MNAETYWNLVLGARDADTVVAEFGLTSDRRGLDEWLGHGEAEAIRQSGGEISLDDLAPHHAAALDELEAAAARAV
jgi:hypothetical protein